MPYPKLVCNSARQIPVCLYGQKIKITIHTWVKRTVEHLQHHAADPTGGGVFEYQLRPFCRIDPYFIKLIHGFQGYPWYFLIFIGGLLLLSEDTVEYSHIANLRDMSECIKNLTPDEMSCEFEIQQTF